MKRPTEEAVGYIPSLQELWQLAQHDVQRPGNIGAGMKVLEALMNLPSFRPSTGSKA